MRPARKIQPHWRLLTLAVITLGSPSVVAHHSAAVYDMRSVVTLRGVVSRYEWKNPHVYIFLEAEDDTGQVIEWAVEGESTALMSRSGWSPETLAPGDRVFARANLNRRPERHEARLIALTTEDGIVLARRASEAPPKVPANGLAGVWDAIRGYDDFEFVRGGLTTRGTTAVSVFEEAQSPVQNCLAFTAPIVTFLPYRNRITVGDDRIVINSEYFDVERIVYMDGRGHPENGERRHQGHSIGRWDGDTLVVDVTNFSPKTDYQGARENLHLVERWTRLDSETIEYVATMDDPTTWTKPWTVAVELKRQDAKQNRIYIEPRCHEGNYGLPAMLAGARADEEAYASGAGPHPASICTAGCSGRTSEENRNPLR